MLGARERWYNIVEWQGDNFKGDDVEELVKELESSLGWPFPLMRDPEIRAAFLSVDRADFVPPELAEHAYDNQPLPIGKWPTISQPAVVAFMLNLRAPKPGARMMDVGAGSGWQTAVLAKLVGESGEVDAVEVVPELCQQAQNNLGKYHFTNINFFCQNARPGLPDKAPFDGIVAGAAGRGVPPAWREQLKVGGKIVAPGVGGGIDNMG